MVQKLHGAQAAVALAKKLRVAQSTPSQEQNSVQNDHVKSANNYDPLRVLAELLTSVK